MYSEEIIEKIQKEYREFRGEMDFVNIRSLYNPLITKGNPYVQEGLIRRLVILCRCIRNIYRIMPISTQERLPIRKSENITINLQSFILNIAGVLDNLAWIAVYEKNIDYGGNRMTVSLFKGPVYESLKLKTKIEDSRNWYDQYLKQYRNALAHNIPLYVPSARYSTEDVEQEKQLQEQLNNLCQNAYSTSIEKIEEIAEKISKLNQQSDSLGSVSMEMVYSSPTEPTKAMFFPAQILCDWMTVKEITLALAEELLLV